MKTVSGLLRAVLLAGLVSLASAQTPDTRWFTDPPAGIDGSVEKPYQISNADELAGLAQLVNSNTYYGCVILTDDIDLESYGKTAVTWNGGKGWIPIGIGQLPPKPGSFLGPIDLAFKGRFDGNGKVIRGLYINDKTLNLAGLFGRTQGGIINLGLEGVDITGRDTVGGVAGFSNGMTNCYSNGTINGSSFVGGVVGFTDAGGVIKQCSSAGTVKGSIAVGGVVGLKEGCSGKITSCFVDILNSSSASAVHGTTYVGGIVGRAHYLSSAIVKESFFTGSVYGSDDVGGVSGGGGRISLCYSTGTVTGSNNVGGILGSAGIVYDSYSTGTVKGNYCVGGVIGRMGGVNTRSIYSTGSVSGRDTVGGVIGFVDDGEFINFNQNTVAALNQSVSGVGGYIGRLIGVRKRMIVSGGVISHYDVKGPIHGVNNAFVGMVGTFGVGYGLDGCSIISDGSIGGIFSSSDLKIQNGKLPGIDAPVDMPEHILNDTTFVGVPITSQSNDACALKRCISIYVDHVGCGTISYQWYSNTIASDNGGTAIPGATENYYAVPGDVAGTFYYYAVVTKTLTAAGDGGTKTATTKSNVFTITIKPSTSAVLSANRAIPSVSPNNAAAVSPINALTGEFTAGPNPANKSGGSVVFYRQGKPMKDATLSVYDASGNFVAKVGISDKAYENGQTKRRVGSWDLADKKGRVVPDGTYLVRGALVTSDGKKERVSLTVGVR